MKIQGKVKIDKIIIKKSSTDVKYANCRITEGIKIKDHYKNCTFLAVAFNLQSEILEQNGEGYYYFTGDVSNNNYTDKDSKTVFSKELILKRLYKLENLQQNYSNEIDDDDLPF